MPAKTALWDSAELLRDREDIAAYLDAALEEAFETKDVSAFNRALGVVARSHGIGKIAQESGHGRESLYKSLSPDPNLVQRLPTSLVSDFPPVQTFIAGELKTIFKSEFDTELRSVFIGQRPVRAFVHLKRFDVPSVARRMFLGGAAVIEAEVDLRDAKTGASVLHYSGDSSTKLLLGGLSAPVAAAISGDQGRPLVHDFLLQYRDWLLRSVQS